MAKRAPDWNHVFIVFEPIDMCLKVRCSDYSVHGFVDEKDCEEHGIVSDFGL